MKRNVVLILLKNLSKIYFSDSANKEVEYKKVIFCTLKNLGGVYIKFLQALCVTQKFSEGWGGPKDFEIFNKVSVENINLNSVLNTEIFSSLDYIPFACGSFAQMYRCRLKTGESVAVKVLRPSIINNLKSDLRLLKKLINIISIFTKNSMVDFKEAYSEFTNTCLLETDYNREIANMEYFGAMYKNHKYIVIPKVYKNLSNKNVIVQEFIEGPTLADIISNMNSEMDLVEYSKSLTGSDVWKQLAIAGGEALRMAMSEEYVYGDPHPGNIILLNDNKLAFVDFGIISRKPISQEAFYLFVKSYYEVLLGNNDYSNLLESTCMCFCPDLLNALEKCFYNQSFINTLINAINRKMMEINKSQKNAEKFANDGHLLKVFTQFIDSKNAIKLKFDTRNFQLVKAMQAFISSIITIDNRYGNNKFSELMIASMEYALEYTERKGIKKDFNRKTKYSINQSYELLIDMITSIANNDEFLFENICREI